jgi:hypothetical protein
VPLEVKFMHFKSVNSALLDASSQHCLYVFSPFIIPNIRQMPLCKPTTVGVVNAVLRNGKNALLGEEKLLDGAVGGRMTTVGRVAFEVRAEEGRDASLGMVRIIVTTAGCARTYSLGCCPSIAILV